MPRSGRPPPQRRQHSLWLLLLGKGLRASAQRDLDALALAAQAGGVPRTNRRASAEEVIE